MKVVKPIIINDSKFVSSTILENDYAVWGGSTTYSTGNRVIKGHKIWESVQNTNLNKDPEDPANVGWWAFVGPTNRWAMFDDRVNSQSTSELEIEVVITPGRIDTLGFLNVDAAEIEVLMTAEGGTVFHETISLIPTDSVSDWHSYFFEAIEYEDYMVIQNLPLYGDCEITITFRKSSGTVRVGMIVAGQSYSLGLTQYGASVGILDYSRKTTDDFGSVYITKRDFSRRQTVNIAVPATGVDKLYRQLSEIRSTPALWIGSDAYKSMITYGFYRDFDVDIAYPTVSYCSLTIEGMT